VGADFKVGPWLVEPGLNTVSRNGSNVHLEPKVMEVLVCLARHAGETVPKDQLMREVWSDTFVTDDVLIRAVSELRRIFEDDAREPSFIQTIPKRGYRLIAPVKRIEKQTTPLSSSPLVGTEPSGPIRKRRALAVALVTVALIVLTVGARSLWFGKSTSTQIRSIAVLPLENLSGDPNQEYLSDGMTDVLITDLAQMGSLKVISRTSSMQYKQTKKSLPEIARELNVDGIIEGTVQRSGERVRITAQLFYAPSDKHLWANSYERDLKDVFALERDVSSDIARQVHVRLRTEGSTRLTEPHPVTLVALEAYLRGNSHMHKFGRGLGDEELRLASQHFRQAIDAEPNFAPAFVGMSKARHETLRSSSEDVEMARNSAERATELDPNLSDAWTQLADIQCDFWEWAAAEQDYRRALALNPNDALAHEHLGWVLDAFGRMEEGWKHAELAQQLDPNESHIEVALDHRHQYDQSIQHLTTMLEADPDNGVLHHKLYESYAGKGMYEEAIAQLGQTLVLFGLSDSAAKVRAAFPASGYQGAMRRYAEELEHLNATNQVFAPINIAIAYTAAGDKDRALYWLEQIHKFRGRRTAGYPVVLINRTPTLEPLHDDLRYANLLQRMGLPR